MFLALTADQRYWNKNEKILFLGEWCCLYSQKHVWSKLEYQVLPYHWDDRKRLNADCRYMQFLYERYVEELAFQLNQLHGQKYSIRYWRILIGPWLTRFIPIFYDAYLSIKSAVDSNHISNTWVTNADPTESLPYDTETFLSWVLNYEEYHQFLYSWIIKERGGVPFEVKNINSIRLTNEIKEFDLTIHKRPTFSKKIIGVLKDISIGMARCLPRSWNEVVIESSYMDFLDMVKLRLSLKQFPLSYFLDNLKLNLSLDMKSRQKITLQQGKNTFELLLSKIVPEQIPLVFIEGYSEMRSKSLAMFPRRPKAILSEIGICLDRGFKFWTAHQVDKGVKLVGIQHGGGYGCSLWALGEHHEIKICDRFFSWGWRDKDRLITLPISSPRLSGLKKKIKSDSKGGILCVGFSLAPRYLYLLYSAPISSQILEYIKDQQDFVRSISSDVRAILSYRLFPIDDGWDLESRWIDNDPSINFYRGRRPLIQEFNEYRLCVHSYMGTSYIESMVANFPTIVFRNPAHWELRDSAKPFFEKLTEVGILHDSPESAAAKVNCIFKDSMSWWMSDKVQEAKNEFCDIFARTSDHWNNEWVSEIKKLIKE